MPNEEGRKVPEFKACDEAVAGMDSSLPLVVTHADILARGKLLWNQPGGCPPEMDPLNPSV